MLLTMIKINTNHSLTIKKKEFNEVLLLLVNMELIVEYDCS
jgi:hypothetical protein